MSTDSLFIVQKQSLASDVISMTTSPQFLWISFLCCCLQTWTSAIKYRDLVTRTLSVTILKAPTSAAATLATLVMDELAHVSEDAFSFVLFCELWNAGVRKRQFVSTNRLSFRASKPARRMPRHVPTWSTSGWLVEDHTTNSYKIISPFQGDAGR